MRPLHARLVREAQRRDPKFTPRPLTAEALKPVERRLGSMSEDYRAFLLEVGRLSGGPSAGFRVGHPGDFDTTELPEDFVPFAEDEDHVFAFAHEVDRRQRVEELRERAVGKKGAERARLDAEIEAADLDADGPVALGIGTWSKHDGEVTRSKGTFAVWLESVTTPKPKPKASARGLPKGAAAATPDANLSRALDLIDWLVATEKLEVDATFDENACAKKLAKCLGDVESVIEVIVDARGVVELYANEDDIESALNPG